jgi:hypothetical protein
MTKILERMTLNFLAGPIAHHTDYPGNFTTATHIFTLDAVNLVPVTLLLTFA